jgi:anti-sigma B factor antagonist
MSVPARQSTASGGRAQLTVVGTSRSSADGAPRKTSGLEPFTVEVQRRDDVAIVQPRGELDLATAETLSAALDGIEGSGRIVLDLRGLSFIDSTGLHLLMALDRRAKRDAFELTLVAPAAPIDRAIQLCGLERVLPFVVAVDAIDSQPGRSATGSPQGGS